MAPKRHVFVFLELTDAERVSKTDVGSVVSSAVMRSGYSNSDVKKCVRYGPATPTASDTLWSRYTVVKGSARKGAIVAGMIDFVVCNAAARAGVSCVACIVSVGPYSFHGAEYVVEMIEAYGWKVHVHDPV